MEKAAEDIRDTFDDKKNVKYDITNEYNIKMKKIELEFDPNRIHLFRVSLTTNEIRLQQY